MARTISPKDSKFHEEQGVITSMTEQNITQWGLDRTWFESVVKPAKTGWENAWAAYQDPAQRTRVITFTKNEKRETYEKILRILVQLLKYNQRITDENRTAMGIVMRNTTGTPVKAPKTRPEFIIDTSTIRRLIIAFWNLTGRSKAKPHGVHGAEIRWAILDHPPVSVEELVHSSFDTHSPFELAFDESERGKTVYICLRWENTRGEKGPWSEIVKAVIP
ncbi:MAG: hypothetical protein LBL33_08625 [Tannerella sp.]|jgi:hypothetical protein|nr:hypothetical protein [Tannerella sp.]